MLKDDLEKNIEVILEKDGYTISKHKGCFDIIAKKDRLLLLKILQNIDSLSEEQTNNLKIIANNLEATAIVIGKNTTREKLKSGIVYERFEIPCVSPETFSSLIISKIFPKMYRDKGGLYVEIDSDILKETRNKKKLTQRELAEIVGINKKVIYEHEKKELRMMLDIAGKIENILKKKIIKPVDIFGFEQREIKTYPKNILEQQVGSDLRKIGFKIDYVKQAPFDVFAKEKALVISDVEDNRKRLKERALHLKEFIKTVDKSAIVITDKSNESDIEGIPVVKRKDIKEMKSKDIIKLARKSR